MGTNKPKLNSMTPSIVAKLKALGYTCIENVPRGLQVRCKMFCTKHNTIFSSYIYSILKGTYKNTTVNTICKDCLLEKAKEAIDKGIIYTNGCKSDIRIAQYLFNAFHKYNHTLLGIENNNFKIQCNVTGKIHFTNNIRTELGEGKTECYNCYCKVQKEKAKKLSNQSKYFYINENNEKRCRKCNKIILSKRGICRDCFPSKRVYKPNLLRKEKSLKRVRLKNRKLELFIKKIIEVNNLSGLKKILTTYSAKSHSYKYIKFLTKNNICYVVDVKGYKIIKSYYKCEKITIIEANNFKTEYVDMAKKLTNIEKLTRAKNKALPFNNIEIIGVQENKVKFKCTKHKKIFTKDYTKYMQARYPCKYCKNDILSKNISNGLVGKITVPKSSPLNIINAQYQLSDALQKKYARKYGILVECSECHKRYLTTRPSLIKNNYRCIKCQRVSLRREKATLCNQWLGEMQKLWNIKITGYYSKEKAVRIKTKLYKFDGYHEESNTVFEFLGDYWHDYENEGKKFKETFSRLAILSKRYNVIYVWEHDYKNGIPFSGILGTTIPLSLPSQT